MSFKDYIVKEVNNKLMLDLGIKNPMMLPRITKVTLNVGVGREATANKNVIENVQRQLSVIAGQKAVVTKARKSVSAFKIRKGLPIGVKVTLRGKRMYDFLEKLIKIVIPRFRDFRGVDEKCVDSFGNLNLGIREQTIFPEVDFDSVDKIRGMQVIITNTATSHKMGKKLFELLGIPFKNL